ncbi:MAG TPA: hypothetical protein VNQ99_10775 [Xanthobacteraceae bacterium]|nr:hypothetical protein [Xanthobacteraceae bacterium]
MTKPKVGIASYEEMKARTMRIARGGEKPAADDPMVWFPSVAAFEQARSGGNPDLLRAIEEQTPSSPAADEIESDEGER